MPQQQSAIASTMPMLSVILPNYNHGRYLERALDALLAQERPADEIIVLDDGSTDNSREIIARYAAINPSIRPMPNERNIGVIATLTRGLDAARGKYVYFGAADDFVLPGFFATGLAALEAHPQTGMFCSEMVLVDGNSGRALGYRPPVRPRFSAGLVESGQFVSLLRSADNFLLTGSSLIRRDDAVRARGFDAELSTFADAYLVRKVALTSGFYYCPRAFLTWNIFNDSVSRKTAGELDRSKAVFNAIEKRMTADPAFPQWYWKIFVRRWRFSACRVAVQDNPINRIVLTELGAQNKADRLFLDWILQVTPGAPTRFILLVWLWLRFRPISLVKLASTAVARIFKSGSE